MCPAFHGAPIGRINGQTAASFGERDRCEAMWMFDLALEYCSAFVSTLWVRFQADRGRSPWQ